MSLLLFKGPGVVLDSIPALEIRDKNLTCAQELWTHGDSINSINDYDTRKLLGITIKHTSSLLQPWILLFSLSLSVLYRHRKLCRRAERMFTLISGRVPILLLNYSKTIHKLFYNSGSGK
jgi:hypothetical protein